MLLNKRSIFAFFILSCAVSAAEATTLTANTCTQTDVAAKVNAASNGDTVIIPAGTCTWATNVTVNKGITLQGAGVGLTVITDGTSTGNEMLTWNPVDGFLNRLTGITFAGGTSAEHFSGIVQVKGTASQMRVDHCTFLTTNTAGMFIYGYVRGVVDHNTFDLSKSGASGFGIYIMHNLWKGQPGSDYGDSSWADADSLGTAQAMFVEDNAFTNDQSLNPHQYANDGWNGGRVVYRHNTYTNTTWANHGTESGGRWRSQRQFEIYNNTFSLAGTDFEDMIDIRGGTGVIFNNTATEIANSGFASLKYFRSNQAFDPWGQATGSNVWDENAQPGGHRCLDQPGVGQGLLLSSPLNQTTPITPTGWPQQALDPIYAWNNTKNGAAVNVTSAYTVVAENRDFFNGTPKPGYTPYTYPHPLVSGSTPPPPPPPTTSPCDVNGDGTTNVADVQLEVNMAIGVASCTADINKDGVCNVIDVQRVVNAALGGQCVTQ